MAEEKSRNKSLVPVITGITIFMLSAFFLVFLRVYTDYKSSVETWADYASSEFESGSGTAEDPYCIKNVEQLALLAVKTDKGEVSKDSYFILSDDIYASEYVWKPIGTEKPFEGVFDGNNHTISGLRLEARKGISCYGLFGTLSGIATDVKIEDSNVNISFVTNRKKRQPQGDLYVGCLAGKVNGYVNGASTTGSMYLEEASNLYMGDLIGWCEDGRAYDLYSHVSSRVVNKNASTIGGIIGKVSGNSSLKRLQKFGKFQIEGNSENIVAAGIVANAASWNRIDCTDVVAATVINVTDKIKSSAVLGGIIGVCPDENSEALLSRCICKVHVKNSKKDKYIQIFANPEVKETFPEAVNVPFIDDSAVSGLIDCGYFESDKKFIPFTGEKGKNLSKDNTKKYFKGLFKFTANKYWVYEGKNYIRLTEQTNRFYPEYMDKEKALITDENIKGTLYVENGERKVTFTGISDIDGELYYIKNGKLSKSFSGTLEYEGVVYNIENGKVIK